MSHSKIKRPTLRRRPVKGTAAQVELALKAAEMVAESKRRHQPFYEQLQPPTPAPEVVADKMKTARIAASHAGQPPPNMVPANKRFIYKPEVVERVGKTFVTIWRWMGEGTFPTARTVGGQIAWLESDIDEWMESRPLRQYKSRQVA